MPSLVDIGPLILEKNFKDFVKVISLLRNYLPLEKGVVLHLNIHESPSPKHGLYQVWLKSVQWFWRRKKVDDNDDANRQRY